MLRGIEAQSMVTRASEFMREADAQQRKNELARDFMAVQTQAVVEHEQQQVTQTLRAQEGRIQREKEGKNRRGSEHGEPDWEETEEEEAGTHDHLPPARGNYLIDIEI